VGRFRLHIRGFNGADRRLVYGLLFALTVGVRCGAADFELQITLVNAATLGAERRQLLEGAIRQAQAMWEHVITGYQSGIDLAAVQIDVRGSLFLEEALAVAGPTSTIVEGDYTLATRGEITINLEQVLAFANWQGRGAGGLNLLDELIAHEIGHVLGIGTLWNENGVYFDDFKFVGEHGLAAYRDEFDPSATFVPVESAGGASAHAHWNQVFRSTAEEGDPDDPWSLSPQTHIVDASGRDLALELMTGALDPDYGEPFLSRTTVSSLVDLGYAVTTFEDFNGDGAVNGSDLMPWSSAFGSTDLQIDSLRFGDANRDRVVDGVDFLQWQQAVVKSGQPANVPEPSCDSLLLAVIAIAGWFRFARRDALSELASAAIRLAKYADRDQTAETKSSSVETRA